jgi:hypothetical protein
MRAWFLYEHDTEFLGTLLPYTQTLDVASILHAWLVHEEIWIAPKRLSSEMYMVRGNTQYTANLEGYTRKHIQIVIYGIVVTLRNGKLSIPNLML